MFSNKFDVGIVYVLKVEIIRIIFKNLLIKDDIFFFQISCPNFLASFLFCCLHFSLNLHYFFHFFPNKNCQVKNSKPKKHVGWGDRVLIQLFKPKILPN